MARFAHGARKAAVATAAIALLGACYEFAGPAPAPDLFLAGAWHYELIGVPGGGVADTFSLNAINGAIHGAGVEYRGGELRSVATQFTIDGQYSDTTQFFNLRFRFSDGVTESFFGRPFGADSLVGGFVSDVVGVGSARSFYRLAVPPCSDPAPVIYFALTIGPPGSLVLLKDSVDVRSQATLLADRYGFVVDSVFERPGATNSGFSAILSSPTAAVLRCEPSVASVGYRG